MAMISSRWQQRFEHYKMALETIEKVIPIYSEMSELEQDGLIQRFEFTFDLGWKVMQDYLKESGYLDIKGPRPCIKQMMQDNMIDGFKWEEMLIARNELSHIYDGTASRVYLNRIVNDYTPVFREFSIKMAQQL